MIRINLLRDVGGGGVGGGGGVSAGTIGPTIVGTEMTAMGGMESSAGNMDLAIKILYAIVPLILIYAYRSFEATEKQNQLATLNATKNDLNAKLQSYEPGLKDIEQFEEEKNKLNNQLNVIKQLSRERLKNVKSMDAIQGIIPDKAWLTEVKINDDKIEVAGMATDDLVISDFMQDLTKSIYFTHVVLEGSEEVKKDEGVVKQFKIRCNLENL